MLYISSLSIQLKEINYGVYAKKLCIILLCFSDQWKNKAHFLRADVK